MISERRSFVAGEWIDGDEVLAVENPADESFFAELSVTPLPQVRRATAAARRSFDTGVWADVPVRERVRTVHALLDHLDARRADLVDTIVQETGQPAPFAEGLQHRTAISMGRAWADLFERLSHEQANPAPLDDLVGSGLTLSFQRYEPVGVVAAITPYNASVLMAIQKAIPALLAGNSVILRPSPLTPISVLALATAAQAVGIPPGVFNVVIEGGSLGAEHLTSSPDVDMVSFTGSTVIGRSILAQAAPTVKRVALELGGKGAQIFLPDAIDRVVAGALSLVLPTAAQSCVAPSRMLVPQARKDEVLESVADAYRALQVGSPTDPTTDMGPLISAAARERSERIVGSAEEHGAKIVYGGQRPARPDRGYYFEPTVLDVPDSSNPAARQEVFGPVLSVQGYRNLDEAVSIANDSEYGLANYVYGADLPAAVNVARRLRSGAVNVNAGFFSAYAAAGGYKQSGLGRERGIDGIRAFQQTKHIVVGEPR